MTLVAIGVLGVLAVPSILTSTARAGGYDTPMLYSARHMGMGGTAIGYVDDPSALFHNPAGLAHTRRVSVLADFSLLLARVHASPGVGALDLDSELTIAPLGLLGAAYRITDRITVGLGAYPVASAGATYKYDLFGTPIENQTRLVFVEASPAVAIDLPGRLRVGAGYRATYVSLTRFQGDRSAAVAGLDFKMNGWNWAGFRVGAQWTPIDAVKVGTVYRHKTETTVRNDHGVAVGQNFTDIETKFLLPSKLGVGGRVDVGDFGAAVDGEYLWNGQNEGAPLDGLAPNPDPSMPPLPTSVPNVFDWSDEVTLRLGAEYRLVPAPEGGAKRLALRAGYVFDGKTTNERYPSAFGTPPGPTHVITLGGGWTQGRWRFNAAYARRMGEGEVRSEDVSDPTNKPCRFCGVAGKTPYSIGIHGFYLDASYALD